MFLFSCNIYSQTHLNHIIIGYTHINQFMLSFISFFYSTYSSIHTTTSIRIFSSKYSNWLTWLGNIVYFRIHCYHFCICTYISNADDQYYKFLIEFVYIVYDPWGERYRYISLLFCVAYNVSIKIVVVVLDRK